MIISASRRTDIPSCYSDWFFRRLKEGCVCVRNPMNPHQVSHVSLSPEVVDGIVFWTKNPAPMLSRLELLRDYTYYFQFTLNPYGRDIERNVPSKNDIVIPTFQKLSSEIGKERVVWRYDPILLSEKYTMEYHRKYFRLMADRLSDYTEKCTVSFIDIYKNIQRSITPLGITAPSQNQIFDLMGVFSEIAEEHGIYIDTCAEEIDLKRLGIRHASCIDKERLARIGHYKLDISQDKNQRSACGCVSSIDIGAYNTCENGCVYCYANFNQTLVRNCRSAYAPDTPLLCGTLSEDDAVKKKPMASNKVMQLDMF